MFQHCPDFPSLPSSVENPQYPPAYNRSLSNSPIVLDDYNSDLNFIIERDGFTGSSLHQEGFEYLWAGARATYGVKSGKACFEVRILNKLPTKMADTEQSPHVARVGWSTDDSGLIVGEDKLSYGYGGTAKTSVNSKFFDYGQRYTVNDVISCYIDLDQKCIFFAKNGHFLGVAFELRDLANGVAFYPHVTIKNMKVMVNFGCHQPTVPPVEGFTMMEQIPRDLLVRGTRGPDTRRDAQVIMMVGLPGAGKTCWANEFARNYKSLKINVLGTNTVMDKMKVTGLARNRNYHGRWDQLIKQATKVLNKMLEIAEKKNRNYILDQTNVYPNARQRKMSKFHGFKRIAAVIVNTNEVLKERSEKREKEEGKIIPVSAVMEMKANFTLPEVGETFDDVWFIEADRESSVRLLEGFREEGKIFKENERAKEEMKRKRGDSPPTDHPPAKEQAYQASRDTGVLRHPHSQPQHYLSAGFGPRDTRPSYGAPSFQPPSRYPPPQHNNGVDRHFDRYTQPYATSGSPYGHYAQQLQHYPNTNYYQDPRINLCGAGHCASNNDNYPIQESLPSGCSIFEPLTNNPHYSHRQPQEHEYQGGSGQRCEGQQCDSTQRNQNYSSYPQYSGGHR